MAESQQEPISSRLIRLNHAVLGRSDPTFSTRKFVHRDSLLDALFVLYEECNTIYMKKDKHVAAFVDKFRDVISELRKIRVSVRDFEVKKIIGRGNFGEVQVVREKDTGDVYAMKVLRKSETLAHQSVAFYEEERDIMAKSTSPWITKLQYAFQDVDHLYLIMEFHPGGDMLSLLEKYNVLTEEMTTFYLAELVLAINSVHSMGYVHRDIKPDNVLIDRTGHIKLADFGSASKLDSNDLVINKMPVGTPDYVAPEVLSSTNAVLNSSNGYGMECDWWSLGILTYEMLFGVTPFADEKLLITYNNIMNFKKSLMFPEEAAEVSELLIDIIKNLLQDSQQRFGYSQLLNHALFIDVDWNSLRQTLPPYVPNVSSQDDTSNFDEFEHENRPSLQDLKTKKEFSGKNLPFIGFTYTSVPIVERNSGGLDSIVNSPISCIGDSEMPRKKTADLQNKVSDLHAAVEVLKAENEKLQNSVKNKEKKIKSFEKENTRLEDIISKLNADKKELKRLLAYEREDRAITEKKASQIIKCLKMRKGMNTSNLDSSNDEKGDATLNHGFLEEIDVTKFEEISKQKMELENELTNVKSMLSDYQEHLAEKKEGEKKFLQTVQEFEKTISSLNEELKMVSQEKLSLNATVEKLKMQCEKTKEELDKAVAANREAESQIESLKKVIVKLENDASQTEKRNIIKLNQELVEVKREVADLESKLQIKDSTISELQQCLADKERKCCELESQIQTFEQEMGLTSTMKVNLEEDLKKLEIKECNLIKDKEQLQNMITKLEVRCQELEVKGLENTPSKEKFSHEIGERTRQPSKENNMDLIMNQEKSFSCSNPDHQSEMKRLEADISLFKGIAKNYDDMKSNYEKKLKEKEDLLSNISLDNRILTREKKQAEDMINTLRDSNRNFRDKLRDLQSINAEKIKIEAQQIQQISNLEAEVIKRQKEIDEINKLYEEIKDTSEKYAKSQGQYEEITRQNENLKKQLIQKEKENEKLLDEMKNLKSEVYAKENECTKSKNIITMLQNTCTEMEEDLSTFEYLAKTRDTDVDELKKENDHLRRELEKLSKDFNHINVFHDEETKTKEELKQHIDEMIEEFKNQESIHEAEVQSLKDQISHEKKIIVDLENQVSELEHKLLQQDNSGKTMMKKVMSLEEEMVQIKEEATRHITNIASLKATNLNLTQALEQAVESQKQKQEIIDQLYNELERAEANHKHEKVKLQETVAQQTKLIDFLQSKNEVMEKKKRAINVPRIFGKKDNSAALSLLQQQQRDTEGLERERTRCRRLQDQLSQARAENMALRHELNQKATKTPIKEKASVPISPMSRAVHTALTGSPSMNGEVDKPEFPTEETPKGFFKPQGMKHRIPHRFIEIMCMRGSKCAACLDSIHFGRPGARCQECSVVCHPKCAASLPRTCGLPSGFIQHFKSAVNEKTSVHNRCAAVETEPAGWIKVPKSNKAGWERRYIRLIGPILYFFENEEQDTKKALDTVDFSMTDSEVVVISAVSAAELTSAATSDLPFVLKIEYHPRTTCWPAKCIYMMTNSFEDKQKWFSVLENLVKENKKDHDLENKFIEHPVLKLKGDKRIDALCICILSNNILLLGAMEGLFVVSLDDHSFGSILCKVNGIDSVYQITCITTIETIVAIVGEKRCLNIIDVSILKSWTEGKSNLSPVQMAPVDAIQDCHLFAVQDTGSSNSPYLCSATSNAITLSRWKANITAFQKEKVLQTPEPCSCIYFSQEVVIFGADKFYELDLKSHHVEEFLDCSDSSLACIVYGVTQLRSFPVAIFQVAPANHPEEYLVCFHELGVFVDSFGQRTRPEDMKWSRLPLAFAYRSPYLFVTHFSSLEVIEIQPQGSLEKGIQAVIDVQNPQYLGPAVKNGAVYIASNCEQSLEVLCIEGQLIKQKHDVNSATEIESRFSKESLTEIESEGLDFSFSGSIIQSLDASDDSSSVNSSDVASTQS